MRIKAYVVGSVISASLVTVYAGVTRPNFYSAAVLISQNNACLLALSNFALVVAGSVMYGLQQFLFGPLRPLETEQLWERGWFAMMEWVFAMSTFRDEFGVWFLVMFISLFAGKIWGWIAEGRVEHLEQQAPNDTRLLHPRLVTSLTIYLAFAASMFNYCLDVVVMEARPGMTIMFVFEFAILCVSAVTACARYGIWAQEHRITQQQLVQAVEARKAEIRKQRKEAEDRIAANPEAEDAPRMEDLPREEDVDENEMEAPGWEAKRGWLFALDIVSDLLKLVAYMAFFTILTVFYGIPIYIIRDLYMTMRSFTKRVSDYLRFQAATRDMDTRYPNATAADLADDNTCIVCREEMRPVDGDGAAGGAVGQAMAQRQKPKKLPCGHILHFACLSSWLERQQACPICRRSVFTAGQGPAGAAQAGAGARAPGAAGPGAPNQNPHRGQQAQNQGRVFRLGPLRVQLGGQLPGRHNDQDLLNALGRLAQNHRQAQQRNRDIMNGGAPNAAAAAAPGGSTAPAPTTDLTTPSVHDPANSDIHPGIRSAAARMALNTIEQQIQREIQALNIQGQRANTLRNLLNELDRTRNIPVPPPRQPQQRTALTPGGMPPGVFNAYNIAPAYSTLNANGLQLHQQTYPIARAADGSATGAAPSGVVLPPGWTLTPLNAPSDENSGPQVLQNLLHAQAPSRAPSTHFNQPNNPLAQFSQFFINSMPNGHTHPHGHTHHHGNGSSTHISPAAHGPFAPPPHPPTSVPTMNGASTNGSPPASGSHELTPTSSNPALPTAGTSAPAHLADAVDENIPAPPTAVTSGWSFPSAAGSAAPTSTAAPTSESADKGKGKAVNGIAETENRSVPETIVEPPTPVSEGRALRASVEDAEGEDDK